MDIIQNRKINKLNKTAKKISKLEPSIKNLSDEDLKKKTDEFKKRIANGETLDSIMPETFAVVREASRRVLGKRLFDVQLMSSIVLHNGDISEQKTGEGKTLALTPAAYLNALTGKGVHIVTVNEYLAERDSEEMGKVFGFLGLTTSCILNSMSPEEKKVAYNADITYGTNSEFGFDYLRDNMAVKKEDQVQRGLNFAIVDEVDSILIDEARTPLIISGPDNIPVSYYGQANTFVRRLKSNDYDINIKDRQIYLTDSGIAKAEKTFGISNYADSENMQVQHFVMQALKANYIMKKNVDYIVSSEKEVLIVDEFTGRVMDGRRFSDGLHQAIEAKEGVKIKEESKTYATITLQNYFRMYDKLCGLSGTAKNEESELVEIYNMNVVQIPTNKPVQRIDHEDLIFATENEKWNAVADRVEELHKTGRPVLIGTTSVDNSEKLSLLLKKRGLQHNVLNAKNHKNEAFIVAQAGRVNAITVATNMAGRGTDILLGGNAEMIAKKIIENAMKKKSENPQVDMSSASVEDEYFDDFIKDNARTRIEEKCKEEQEKVLSLGGLYIIGTERHESRRIDDQLRGRSGRQGDPGESQFFISLEDELFLRFGKERLETILKKNSFAEGKPITSKKISKFITETQKMVEGNNFGIRKNVLKYDDVSNQQRKIIYSLRQSILDQANMKPVIEKMTRENFTSVFNYMTRDDKYTESINMDSLSSVCNQMYGFMPKTPRSFKNMTKVEYFNYLLNSILSQYDKKEKEFGEDSMRIFERQIALRVIDVFWMQHIDEMDHLKRGVGLVSIGQKDPAQEYAKEGFKLFETMMNGISADVVKYCYNVKFV